MQETDQHTEEQKKRHRRKTSEIVEERVEQELSAMKEELLKLKAENMQLQSKLKDKKDTRDLPTKQKESDVIGLSELRQEDERKIKCVFRCLKPPGGSVTFYFRKYKGPIEKYHLEDGKEYELPLMVIDHLNENCFEADKTYLLDENGDQISGVGKKHYRFSVNTNYREVAHV